MASVKVRPEVVVALTVGGGLSLSFMAWLYGYRVLAMVLLGVAGLCFAGSLVYLVSKERTR